MTNKGFPSMAEQIEYLLSRLRDRGMVKKGSDLSFLDIGLLFVPDDYPVTPRAADGYESDIKAIRSELKAAIERTFNVVLVQVAHSWFKKRRMPTVPEECRDYAVLGSRGCGGWVVYDESVDAHAWLYHAPAEVSTRIVTSRLRSVLQEAQSLIESGMDIGDLPDGLRHDSAALVNLIGSHMERLSEHAGELPLALPSVADAQS